MSENDVLCSGVDKCKDLDGAVNIIHHRGKEINQRIEYCSGRTPHLFNYEECRGIVCPFTHERVECKRIWMRVTR